MGGSCGESLCLQMEPLTVCGCRRKALSKFPRLGALENYTMKTGYIQFTSNFSTAMGCDSKGRSKMPQEDIGGHFHL